MVESELLVPNFCVANNRTVYRNDSNFFLQFQNGLVKRSSSGFVQDVREMRRRAGLSPDSRAGGGKVESSAGTPNIYPPESQNHNHQAG